MIKTISPDQNKRKTLKMSRYTNKKPGGLLGLWTHSFVQEELVFSEVEAAQQPPQDTNGGFEKIHVHVLVEGQLLLHPAPRFGKFY